MNRAVRCLCETRCRRIFDEYRLLLAPATGVPPFHGDTLRLGPEVSDRSVVHPVLLHGSLGLGGNGGDTPQLPRRSDVFSGAYERAEIPCEAGRRTS
jgi:hypothetical protein